MNTCHICGKPRGRYPNWILTHGRQMHVGCLANHHDELLRALQDVLPWVIVPPGTPQAVQAVKRAGEALGKISS